MSAYKNYIPIPHWNGSKWIPCNHTKCGTGEEYFNGYLIVPWPNEFDPSTLIPPKFNIGDTVYFKWGSEDGVKIGKIRSIRTFGGAFNDEDINEIIKDRYFREPDYDIYWNGHGRSVREYNIVGA